MLIWSDPEVGRKVQEREATYQLREPSGTYNPHFGAEKGNIGGKNAYIWNFNEV